MGIDQAKTNGGCPPRGAQPPDFLNRGNIEEGARTKFLDAERCQVRR